MAAEFVIALAYAGVGGAVASIGAAVVTARAGRGESRAHAANLLTEAASGLADRLSRSNTELEEDNRKLRRAVLNTTDILDILIPLMGNTIPPEVVTEAKRVSVVAKLST